ncbi:MAG: glycoside hydrolase family 27 protein [Oscillospiraceae bacterium]|nr:glycoside hydrolase family 27 protein [Oscillospiraceae bacterium]
MKNKNLIAQTPPMGFNSWDCYGAGINEEQLLGNAEYMRDNLRQYGWEYVVCDIQWYEPTADSCNYHYFADLCMDEYSRLIPAENRFPSSKGGKGFKPIADKIHDMGLKFGIHILRGIPRQAVHRNTPTVTPGVTARMIAQGYSVCPWNPDMYGVDYKAFGAQEYYNSLFELYASWDVDFVKVDDISNTEFSPNNPYSAEKEIEMIRKAIDLCGRDMVLSLSPGPAPIEKAFHLQKNANMWRMSGDFWDRSEALDNMFRLCEKWYAHISPGCWPDCDMLPLGVLQLNDPNPLYRARNTRFTPNEQKTVMNLWCIFRSPLMFGGEMRLNDDFTLSLITNRELLEINQHSSCNRPLISDSQKAVWTCTDKDGNSVYAVFNLMHEDQEISFETDEESPFSIYDLWTKKESPASSKELSFNLQPRESIIFRILHK